MSDFDQFFRRRLGGERPYSGRDKNWRQLSKRLEAFESGVQDGGNLAHSARPRARYFWPVAAGLALATGVWLGWENRALRRENLALKERIEQDNPLPPAPATGGTPAIALQPAPADRDKNVSDAYSDPKQPDSAEKAGMQGVEYPAGQTQREAGENRDPATGKSSGRGATGEDTAEVSTPDTDVATATDSPVAPQPETAFAPVATRPFPAVRSLDSQQVLPLMPLAAAAPQAPHTKPVRVPIRIRAGIQAVAGLSAPRTEGVSLLTGQAFSAEVRVWRNFWAGGSADLMRYEVSASRVPEKCPFPDQPQPPTGNHGGGNPPEPYDLKKVESEQRQRRFAAGLRYELPGKGWLRPSVRLAHVWTQAPSALVSYRFEERPHGGGPGGGGPGGPGGPPRQESITKRSDTRWFSNTWRLGGGLDARLGAWSVGLSADYDKHAGSGEPLFDALLLRAGATYQF